MASSLYQWHQGWSLLFLPWVLWSVIPPWHDVSLLTTFVISQVLLYSMQHVRGMLILSTLVLLLWTKSLLTRWYRTQTLTREFFKRLLYMGVTALVSLAAVFVVWMPLYEAYACVVSKLDRATAKQAMDWRNTVFLIAGICLATSSIAQTDLVLRPSQVDNTGLAWVMRKLTHFLYRFIRYFLRDVLAMLRTAERCVHAGYKNRGRRGGSKQNCDMSDDDDEEEQVTEELRKQSDSSLSSAARSSRQTRSPVSIRTRSSSDARRVSSTDVPDNSLTSLLPNRHWLRSSHRSLMEEESASDIQPGPFRKPASSPDKARRKMGVHSRYPSWDSERLSMESTSDIQFVPPKKPTRPLNKAKIKASFFSQHLSQSPEPSASYNMNEKGSRSKSRLTESVSNESSTSKLSQQSVIPKRKTRSVADTTSQLLQKSVIPGRETSPFFDTPTMAHLTQKTVIPRPETSPVVNTTSQLPQQSVRTTHDISSIIDTTSQLLQSSVLPTRETSAVVDTPTKEHLTPRSSALRRKTRCVLDTTSQLLQKSVIPGPETSPLVDTTSMAHLTQRSFTSIRKTRSTADTQSELLMRSFTPVRETSSVIHTPIMVHLGQRNLTPSPVDTASLTSLPSINLRRKTSSNDTNISSETCSFDSLKSDASSQTEPVSTDSSTSTLLHQSFESRLKTPSPVDTASLVSLPSVNLRRKTSSNETHSSTEICSLDSLKSGSSSQSGRSSPATTRFQSDSSVHFSISAMLQHCALPSPPVTRSHARLVQEKEGAQMNIPRTRKGRRPQTDDWLETAPVKRTSQRWSPECD